MKKNAKRYNEDFKADIILHRPCQAFDISRSGYYDWLRRKHQAARK